MKKVGLTLLLLFSVVRLHAALSDEGVTREKTVMVHFSTTVPANVTSTFLLVSLSTTPGLFPHQESGELDISHVNILMDKVATATTTVRIGFVTFVNTSTGSVTFFYNRSSNKNVSNTIGTDFLNLTQSFIRGKVVSGATATNADKDGTTPYILSNEKRTGSSLYNSTTTLVSPVGAIPPRPGDIVMEILTDATNSVNVLVDILYHSER